VLQGVLEVQRPDAAFYLWAQLPGHVCGGDDVAFGRELLASYNVSSLPGSLLAREVIGANPGANPGAGRLRLALLAPPDDCLAAAHRIAEAVRSNS
jgi:N-succinyldiaminopimelate aminotransferase